MGFEDQNTSEAVDPRPERVHDDNYVLNELKREFQTKLSTPLDLNTAIRTAEVTVQFENNSQADTALRNVTPGDGSVTYSGGAFTVETAATATRHTTVTRPPASAVNVVYRYFSDSRNIFSNTRAVRERVGNRIAILCHYLPPRVGS